MHIPDGILSAPILTGFGVASAVTVAYSAKRAEASTGANRIPLLGVLGAFVFAAQMVNVPVGPGVSGHLLGGALLAATIGPWAATITMTAILLVQSLVFQDGGILALACNVFNMGVLGVWAAYLPYQSLLKMGRPRTGLFLGALLSVLLSAVLALAQVSWSSGVMTQNLWVICIGLFTITGLMEAAISVAAWEAIERLEGRRAAGAPMGSRIWILAASIVVALAGIYLASQAPDVLEYFQEHGGIAAIDTSSEWLRNSAAGFAALLVLYALSLLVSKVIPRRQQPQ
ncbi:energy-coupling factor ABC transporter permease [Bryobacter aggregatus]|uniref:energy-coupling factor ABC transporter permease n=1 Tax=Bryobacter aggregatus TaxID=360054 RepID=UPI00068AEA9B|nr:energy-coupling factor ABC transporter permease [Bryobacter aggregatus]